MKQLTRKERREIYLNAAEKIADNLGDSNFVCNLISLQGKVAEINGYNCDITPSMFPELFLFKDFANNAWLSRPEDWGVGLNKEWYNKKVRIAVNENKLTVLFLCAEMCKNTKK